MRFSAVTIATLALVYGAPLMERAIPNQSNSEQSMMGFHGAMTNHQQVVDTLNRQLKNGDPHAVSDTLVAYITGADSQIDNAIATVGAALSPLTFGLSQAIADVVLGPFVQSVTNGAEVLLARLIGNGADTINAAMVGQLTGDYSRLAKLSSRYNVDSSKLQNLNQQLQNTIPKGKRSSPDDSTTEDSIVGDTVEYVKNSITNLKQTADTMVKNIKSGDGHVNRDLITAAITGLDSQVDILGGTVLKELDPVTLGLSGDLGDFLLGPVFQGITNGLEVIVSNVIGGSVDIVTDGTAKLAMKTLGTMSQIATKLGAKDSVKSSIKNAQEDFAHLPSH